MVDYWKRCAGRLRAQVLRINTHTHYCLRLHWNLFVQVRGSCGGASVPCSLTVYAMTVTASADSIASSWRSVRTQCGHCNGEKGCDCWCPKAAVSTGWGLSERNCVRRTSEERGVVGWRRHRILTDLTRCTDRLLALVSRWI